nr:SlyX family protein [Telluria cellulosilytica]
MAAFFSPTYHAAFTSPDIHVSDENRFIDIEIKLADQENLVDTLNRTIYEQGRRIDQLEAMVAKLADHVRALRDAGQGPLNERPPHY